MKKHFLISLIIMAAAALIATGTTIAYGAESFVLTFGLTCCIGGLVCLFLSLITLLSSSARDLTKTLLLAAGITFLIGTGVCSTMLIGLK